MPGKKESEASSQPLVTEPVADVSTAGAQVARERVTELMRLAREAATIRRAKASDGASSGAPGGIPTHTVAENRDPAPAGSSGAIATSPAAVQEIATDEAMGSPEALPEESEEMEQTVTNEIGSRVPAVRGPYRSAKLPAEIRETVSAESHSASRLPSREATSDEARPRAPAQTSPDRLASWEIERQLQLEGRLEPTAAKTLARWRDAVWEALHGRWSEAGWEFASGVFHLLTQAATWRRVGRAVLHFLARFIPGREPYVSRRSREIKELFRELHEEPKKPGTWTNCPK